MQTISAATAPEAGVTSPTAQVPPPAAATVSLACRDLDRSADWYAELFGRAPDSRPAAGLAIWQEADRPTFALQRDAGLAGQSVVSIVITGIGTTAERIDARQALPDSAANNAGVARLSDPDGNTVFLACA